MLSFLMITNTSSELEKIGQYTPKTGITLTVIL